MALLASLTPRNAGIQSTNEEFARFVAETSYSTDAERFGWSFVHKGLVSEATLAHVLQQAAQAPWWLPVYACEPCFDGGFAVATRIHTGLGVCRHYAGKAPTGGIQKARTLTSPHPVGGATRRCTFHTRTRWSFARGRAAGFPRKRSSSLRRAGASRTGRTRGATSLCLVAGTAPTPGRDRSLSMTAVTTAGSAPVLWMQWSRKTSGLRRGVAAPVSCPGCAHHRAMFTCHRYGLYHVSGNVWEWVLDEWSVDRSKVVTSEAASATAAAAIAKRRTQLEQRGAQATSSDERVKKGGSYMVCPTVFPWSCCRADAGGVVQCGSAMSLTVFDTASRHAATTLQTVLLPTLACVVRMMLLTTPLSCRRAAVCKRYTRRRAYHHTAVYTVHSTTTAALPAVPWRPHPVLRHLPLATLVDWFHGHASHYPLR